MGTLNWTKKTHLAIPWKGGKNETNMSLNHFKLSFDNSAIPSVWLCKNNQNNIYIYHNDIPIEPDLTKILQKHNDVVQQHRVSTDPQVGSSNQNIADFRSKKIVFSQRVYIPQYGRKQKQPTMIYIYIIYMYPYIYRYIRCFPYSRVLRYV